MLFPLAPQHDQDWHRERFCQFVKAKVEAGEPMAHFKLVEHIIRKDEITEDEALWRIGLYLTTYCAMSAEAIWEHWSYRKYLCQPDTFGKWVQENWKGIKLRRERRTVYTTPKFLACVASYDRWMQVDYPVLSKSEATYVDWFESLGHVRYFGTYIQTRGVEGFLRLGLVKNPLTQISLVARHWSPIYTLNLLTNIPEDRLWEEDTLERAGQEAYQDFVLSQSINLPISNFQMLLCEYHGAYKLVNEYIGNSHDEELTFLNGAQGQYWKNQGMKSQLWEARKKLFPILCLGEHQGWTGIRPEPCRWLPSTGVVFSDLLHDYRASVAAHQPVERQHVA